MNKRVWVLAVFVFGLLVSMKTYGEMQGFIKMKDGYFYNSATDEPWVPHGIAYQTWNRPLGVWQTTNQIDYDLDEMVKMGANSIRIDMVWQHIEEDGDNEWSWDNYDYLLQECEKRDIRVFALIGYQWPPNWFPDEWYTMHPPETDSEGIVHTNRWQSDIINYEHPSARAQYAEFFSNVCARYQDNKAVAAWIVGNEYGYLGLWSGLLDGYDPQCEQAFRDWSQAKYTNIAAANATWGTGYESFNDVTLVEQYRAYGAEGAQWADMVQWREDSIADYTAAGARAAKSADTNHLISYSTVGMQWGEEDWRYHAEDRGKITAKCAATNAPVDFFSVNNYPWSILGHESQNGQWGISFTKKVAGVPVLYSETGFTSSETMWPGMNEFRQGPLVRNALWESLECGAIGTHIFSWMDRPYITDREKGFGIVYADRRIKPAFWTCRDAYSLMDQVQIGDLLMGSRDPTPDIAFLWTDANDSQYNRYECEMQQIAGALERIGYEPNFINLADLGSGAYTNYKVVILPRNMRVEDIVPNSTNTTVLDFLRTVVLPKGIHVVASADLPGMQNFNGQARTAFVDEVKELFGVDPSDIGGYEVPERRRNYVSWYWKPIMVSFTTNAVGAISDGYTYQPQVWKYNDEVELADGGILWAEMDSGRNKGFEDSAPDATTVVNWDGSWSDTNDHSSALYVRSGWGWSYAGSNMVQMWGDAGMWRDFDAVPFGRYTASAYLRNNNDDPLRNGSCASVSIEWYGENEEYLGVTESTLLTTNTPSNGWVKYAVDDTAPSNTFKGRRIIRIRPNNLLANGRLDTGIAEYEVYGDRGVCETSTVYTWTGDWGCSTFDQYSTGGTPPEGTACFFSASCSWAGWGVFRTSGTKDLSSYANGTLTFMLKSTESLRVEVEGPQGTKGQVNVASTTGNWLEISIPMSSFSGVDFSQIHGFFSISSDSATTNYVDDIRWCKGSEEVPENWSQWNDGSHAPEYAVRLGTSDNSWMFWWDGGIYQDVTTGFSDGDKVKFGGWLYMPSNDRLRGGSKYGVIEAEFYNGESLLSSSSATPTITQSSAVDQWIHAEESVTVPTNCTRIRVLARCNDYWSGDGRFMVDDVYLRDVSRGDGSVYMDNLQKNPAVIVKDHGAGKAAIFTYSVGDNKPDGNFDGQPDVIPWKYRYDILSSLIKDYFGVQPGLSTSGTNGYLCLPEYRVCTNGAILMQVKNYLYDTNYTASWTNLGGGSPLTFTITSSLLTGKTIRAFEQGRIIEQGSDGTFSITLDPDGQEMLYAYADDSSAEDIDSSTSDGRMARINASRAGVASSGPSSFPLNCVWTSSWSYGWGSPVVNEDRLYVTRGWGQPYLSCLDVRSGAILWTYNSASNGGGAFNGTSIAVAEGMVFAATKNSCCPTQYPAGAVFALDAYSGAFKWKSAAENYRCTPPVVHDSVVYFSCLSTTDIYMRAVAAASGQILWEKHGISSCDYNGAALVDDVLYQPANTMYALDATNAGQILWSTYVGGYVDTTPAVDNGKVYIAVDGSSYGLKCLDAASGSVLWTNVGYVTGHQSSAVADGRVYITASPTNATSSYYLYCFSALSNGAPLWSYPIGSWTRGSPVICGGQVYLASDQFYAFDATNGALLWSYDSGYGDSGTDPFIKNGWAFFGDGGNGYLYAFSDGSEWPTSAPSENQIIQITDAPALVHPLGDKAYLLKIKYDCVDRSDLVLKTAFMEVGDNGDGLTNEIYQLLSTNVVSYGEAQFWMWIPDPQQSDTDYISTPDGGQYQFTAWLEDTGGVKLIEAVPFPTQLKWGVRPTNNVPTMIDKGQALVIPVEWEDLYETLSWETTPWTRNISFPSRVAIFRSTKTESMYPGHFSRINEVGDWLESEGYVAGNPLDIAFDYIELREVTAIDGDEPAYGPMAYWKFDEGIGNIAYDETENTYKLTTNTYDGRLVGATWVAGKSGYAVDCSGTGRVEVLVNLPTNNWTIAAWFKYPLPSTANYNTLIGGSGSSPLDRHICVQSYSGLLGSYSSGYGGSSFEGCGFRVWWLSEGWHHVAAVRVPSSGMRFYVDGVYVGSCLSRTQTDVARIGNGYYVTESFGTIDDVIIYTNALTAEEVAGEYNKLGGTYAEGHVAFSDTFGDDNYDGWERAAGAANWEGVSNALRAWRIGNDDNILAVASMAGKTAWWAFDEGSGTNVSDSSDNGYDGVFRAAPAWVSGHSGQALAFTGSLDAVDVTGVEPTDAWTIGAWFQYPLAVSTSLFHVLTCGDTNNDLHIAVNTNGYLGSYLPGVFGGVGDEFMDCGFNMSTLSSGWHQVVAAAEGGRWSGYTHFYIDGALVGSIGYQAVGAIRWLGNHRDGGRPWGTVDDMRVYNRVLTAGEIAQWYAGSDPSESYDGDKFIVQAEVKYNAQDEYFNDIEIYPRYVDRNNFVKVGIRNYYGFWRLKYTVRVNTNNISQGWLYDFPKTNRPVEDTWYNLKVQCISNTFQVFFDGREVESFVDTNFPSGKIAVGSKAVQLGIWEPQKGYYFIDDDEYSYWSSDEQEQVTTGYPLNLDWGYLNTFFPTLILPGTYVMSDVEVSNVVTWINKGLYRLIATDGGVAMTDETGSPDTGRIESLFGVNAYLTNLAEVSRLTIGTNDHYVTLDYPAGSQLAVTGTATAWGLVTDGTALATMTNGANWPSLIANVITNDPLSPKKVFCFNFGADTEGQLTNALSVVSKRALEWAQGEAYKITVELKCPVITTNPNLDLVLLSTSVWVLAGSGTSNIVVNIPSDGIMTGTNLYWAIYVSPWDGTNAWTTHCGFFSSGNDSNNFTTLEGMGLQILGMTSYAYGGRDWDMWLAYNTLTQTVTMLYGLKEKGTLSDEDNWDDGDSVGWTIASSTNISWVVTNGALRASVVGGGGYAYATRDGLDLSTKNITMECDMYFGGGAQNGGLVYRGHVLYVSPALCGWADDAPNYITNNTGVTTGVWQHVVLNIRDGAPYLMSDLYVDGWPVFVSEPIQVTNWSEVSVGLLSSYYSGYVEWDNYRVADEQYSFTASNNVCGWYVPTSTNPVFWATAPDYDPDWWEYDGTAYGGQYSWYVYFKGQGVHGYQDVGLYFAPRLMVELTNFPTQISAGENVDVPVDWENLDKVPVKLGIYLQDALTGTRYFESNYTLYSYSGSGAYPLTVPTTVPNGSEYSWVAYIYPTNAVDDLYPSNTAYGIQGERLGRDDTYRFDRWGLGIEPETTVTVSSTGGYYIAYHDVGIPMGASAYTWGGGTWNGDYVTNDAPEGYKCWRTTVSSDYAGWGVVYPNYDVDLSRFNYMKFWVKAWESLKVEIEAPQGSKKYVFLTNGVWNPAQQGEWQEITLPLSSFKNSYGVGFATQDLETVFGSYLATLQVPVRYAMSFVTPEMGWAVGSAPYGGGNIRRTTDAGATWEVQLSTNGGNADTLYDVDFVDTNVGWAICYTNFLKTVNGGATWAKYGFGVATNLALMRSIEFVNSSTGYACGYYGRILKTTDGGSTWTVQNSGTNAWLYKIRFIDGWTGWCCGDDLAMLKTTDGGANWLPQTVPTNIYFGWDTIQDICFLNSNTGWACGNGGYVIKTTDGGSTWSFVNLQVGTVYLNAISWSDATNGWIAGYSSGYFGPYATIVKTTDGGANWINWYNIIGKTIYDVYFMNQDTGLVCGGCGAVYKTTDAHPSQPTWMDTFPQTRQMFIDNVRWSASP